LSISTSFADVNRLSKEQGTVSTATTKKSQIDLSLLFGSREKRLYTDEFDYTSRRKAIPSFPSGTSVAASPQLTRTARTSSAPISPPRSSHPPDHHPPPPSRPSDY